MCLEHLSPFVMNREQYEMFMPLTTHFCFCGLYIFVHEHSDEHCVYINDHLQPLVLYTHIAVYQFVLLNPSNTPIGGPDLYPGFHVLEMSTSKGSSIIEGTSSALEQGLHMQPAGSISCTMRVS